MAAAPEAEEVKEEVEEGKEEVAVAVLPCWVVGGGREGEANVRARKERGGGEEVLYWRSGVLRPLLLVWLPKRRAKMPAPVPAPTPTAHSPFPPPSLPSMRA